MLFEGKKILITGGTGSLGRALTKKLLKLNVDTIRIFSRNESKQIEMESEIPDKRLRFFLGDVNDLDRLKRAVEDVDYVYHAAALKHVPKIEYNPFEAIKTNVIGSQNVIEACLHENVEKAICIGTDKAVSPLNTYGATKLLMENLFTTANNYMNPKKHRTKFIGVRYGNVFGSSGSVVPKFIEQIIKNQKITITDMKMTRFSITMEQALDFILKSTKFGKGSETFLPKIKSYVISDLMDAITEIMGKGDYEIIGIRPGEKLHETLLNKDELRQSWEYEGMYMKTNPISFLYDQNEIGKIYPNIKQIENISEYSSNLVEKITKEELKKTILESNIIPKNS